MVLYLLDIVTKEFGKQNIGLYRNDGLSCFENISGPYSENIKKKLFKIFKSNGSSITVECNVIVTYFLDVTFDLKSATYDPYRKLNNEPLYINKHSNHPPSIINQIRSLISNRISENSCDINHFDKAAPDYNIALKNSGFNEIITYVPSPSKLQTHKTQIFLVQPPYGANVKTNIGKFFMRLVDKHFPRHHKYYKVFNRNNIKLSYSYMPNMNNVIRKHNSKIMKNPGPSTTKTCNCCQLLWMVTVFLNALFTKHLLLPLLVKITMVLVKILSKNVTITINVLLEINLVKRTLNCPSTYGN